MVQTEKTKEEGLKVWKRWNTYHLRGHKHIGKQIMKKYGLVQKDIDDMRRELINRYQRNRRKKLKLKRELEGGIENEETKESFKEETIEEKDS